MNSKQTTLALSKDSIAAEVDAVLWTRLQAMRGQASETDVPDDSDRAMSTGQSGPNQGHVTIAEHCWSVADSVSVLAPNFPYIHRNHAVELACVLGKIEVEVPELAAAGDSSPEPSDTPDVPELVVANPDQTHLVHSYVERLRPLAGQIHQALLLEAVECKSPEARFVKAVDEIERLASMLLAKGDSVDDSYLTQSAACADAVEQYFPPLRNHSRELLRRIVRGVADERGIDVTSLWKEINPDDPEPGIAASDAGGPSSTSGSAVSVPAKSHRLRLAFDEVAQRPPAQTGLEAYRQISDAINRVEDMYWGAEYWRPPRYVSPGVRTDRLYPIAPESVYPVDGFPGVDLLVSVSECLFISRSGAIEVQGKAREDLFGEVTHFCDRRDHVLFAKPDKSGDGVWHIKNRT